MKTKVLDVNNYWPEINYDETSFHVSGAILKERSHMPTLIKHGCLMSSLVPYKLCVPNSLENWDTTSPFTLLEGSMQVSEFIIAKLILLISHINCWYYYNNLSQNVWQLIKSKHGNQPFFRKIILKIIYLFLKINNIGYIRKS